MGINLCIYIARKDLSKLLDIRENQNFFSWDDFYFLLSYNGVRWYVFQENFNLEPTDYNPISSKELLNHIAKTNAKIKNRERWVDLLSKYELIFAPDTKKISGDYVEIGDLENWIQLLVKAHFDEVSK